jgi:2-phosphosulfolactate phosphatase
VRTTIGRSRSFFEQAEYRIRFERGERGLRAIIRDCTVVVIVDVLSFSTAADVAVTAGARVFATPYSTDVREVAERHNAIYAVARGEETKGRPYSLSPDTLLTVPPDSQLVLPCMDGATLIATSQEGGSRWIMTGCLRNASAAAAFINKHFASDNIAIVAAGERWPNFTLRPALEDDLAAGAILSQLDLTDASPEAKSVAGAFLAMSNNLADAVRTSVSGRELIELGYPHDVESAVQYGVSRTVPVVGRDGFLTTAVY